MSDMSAEAPRSPSRRKLIIAAGAVGGLATAGGVAAIVLGGRKPPEVVATSPIPPADLTPSRSPSATPSTPTKAPTPKPTENPVELAIKEGKLELKDGDWEKYFVAITPEEAQELLKKTNEGITSNENFKFLLPFDPRKSPNLVLKDTGFISSTNRSYKLLGINNLINETAFYAIDNGSSTVGESRSNVSISLVNDKNVYGFVMPRDGIRMFQPLNESVNVDLGKQVVAIGNAGPTEYATRNGLGEFQAVVTFGVNVPQGDSGSIRQLLKKDGKIAFIAQPT